MKTAGSYEVKTHFAQFLKLVMSGEIIEVTLNGIPVAKIVPSSLAKKRSIDDVIHNLKKCRKGRTLGDISKRSLIEEGRRF